MGWTNADWSLPFFPNCSNLAQRLLKISIEEDIPYHSLDILRLWSSEDLVWRTICNHLQHTTLLLIRWQDFFVPPFFWNPEQPQMITVCDNNNPRPHQLARFFCSTNFVSFFVIRRCSRSHWVATKLFAMITNLSPWSGKTTAVAKIGSDNNGTLIKSINLTV